MNNVYLQELRDRRHDDKDVDQARAQQEERVHIDRQGDIISDWLT